MTPRPPTTRGIPNPTPVTGYTPSGLPVQRTAASERPEKAGFSAGSNSAHSPANYQAESECGGVPANVSWPFASLEKGKYGAILADPPWHFKFWWGGHEKRKPAGRRRDDIGPPYQTMKEPELAALPLAELAAPDCVLFLWTCWPTLEQSLRLLSEWGFTYKTCAFSWMKGDPYRLFADDKTPNAGMGYWTRANTEPCLLATRGKPKRLNADVRQGIIAPRREHSRKPDGIHERIERLVAGPYVELFARETRQGWDAWGNETQKFNAASAAA